MSHVRTDIRVAATALLGGLHTSGANVFKGRTYPRSERQLPCLLITTNDEPEIEEGAGQNPQLDRRLELVVRCAAMDSESVDDLIDTMIAEVEERMADAGTLSGLASNVSAPRNIRLGFDDTLQKPLAIADVMFVVAYSTRARSPGISI